MAHFAITIIVGFATPMVFLAEALSQNTVVKILTTVDKSLLALLQPQFFILNHFTYWVNWLFTLIPIPFWLQIPIFFISIPLWSICFGWIFVKLDNWLNHFPVLGKRVF